MANTIYARDIEVGIYAIDSDGARAVYSFENGEDAADQCDADFCFTDWLHSFDCYGLYKVADYDFMGRFGDRCTSFVIFR